MTARLTVVYPFTFFRSGEVIKMKKVSVFGIVAACLALAAGIVLLCVYMRDLRRAARKFWETLEAKRANLKLYME